MKNPNTIIIATIIATFVFSMIVFRPIVAEANNNLLPLPTPSPRKIKTKHKILTSTGDQPELQITNSRKRKTAYKEGGVNDTTYKRRKTKGYTAIPELDANSNFRKRKSTKASKNEISIETIERRKRTRKRKN
ncbi:MAG TPA: hypothetical protein PKY82_17760 [Pyrinomonadaceae bacterium]|nr:hypothetical protein [Pyrinomonadaceae bacterium]